MSDFIVLSKYVWSTWSTTNIPHYESLGYKMEYDDNYYLIYHLRVLPNHLLKSSKELIDVQCPDCGGKRKARWCDIFLSGHTICRACGSFRSNPNLTKEDKERMRLIPNYEHWKKSVLDRDNNTCQHCGDSNKPLVAHHLYSYKHFPKLRTSVQNGITLCCDCHNSFHSYLGGTRVKCTKDDYDRWHGI